MPIVRGASRDRRDVLRQIEDCGDADHGEEEEDDGVCVLSARLSFSLRALANRTKHKSLRRRQHVQWQRHVVLVAPPLKPAVDRGCQPGHWDGEEGAKRVDRSRDGGRCRIGGASAGHGGREDVEERVLSDECSGF